MTFPRVFLAVIIMCVFSVASLLFRIRHRPLSELRRTGAYQHADMDVAVRRSLEQVNLSFFSCQFLIKKFFS